MVGHTSNSSFQSLEKNRLAFIDRSGIHGRQTLHNIVCNYGSGRQSRHIPLEVGTRIYVCSLGPAPMARVLFGEGGCLNHFHPTLIACHSQPSLPTSKAGLGVFRLAGQRPLSALHQGLEGATPNNLHPSHSKHAAVHSAPLAGK